MYRGPFWYLKDPPPKYIPSVTEAIREDHMAASPSEVFSTLHNLLWNEAGLDPQKALEHLTFFFAMRLIEPQIDRLGLPSECKWSTIIDHLSSNWAEDLIHEDLTRAIDAFGSNPFTQNIFKPIEILTTGHAKPHLVRRILTYMHEKIPPEMLSERDVLGDLFEHIYGRGAETLSDFGQYFTGRDICRLSWDIAHELHGGIRREDGGICSFLDPFCGSGGFAIAFVEGMRKVSGGTIDWTNETPSIYCFDKSISAVSTAALNLLIHTGMPHSAPNLVNCDSYRRNISRGTNAISPGVLFDYILCNPPYGGDGGPGGFRYVTTNPVQGKVIEVNDDIATVGIEDNSKVSAGLQLAMSLLADNGVCCIVLPQGFFFGVEAKVVELRKRLVEQFRVHYVVDISAGAFANTMTKTSVLIFQKKGTTEQVRFIDMNRNIFLTVEASQIKKRRYIMDLRSYTRSRLGDISTGYTRHRLGDLVSTKAGKFTSKYAEANRGGYPFYNCKAKQPDGTCRDACFDGEKYILMGLGGGTKMSPTTGIGKVSFQMGPSAATSHVVQLVVRNDSVTVEYLYMLLRLSRRRLVELANTTTGLAGIRQMDLKDLEIDIPPPSRYGSSIGYLMDTFRMWEIDTALLEQSRKDIDRYILSLISMTPREVVPISTLVRTVPVSRKYCVRDGSAVGQYPLLRSSKTGKMSWLDSYTLEGPYIAVGTGGCANVHYHTKFNVTGDFLVLETTSDRIMIEYLYWFLLSHIYLIKECFNGTCLGHLSRDAFFDTPVALISLEDQMRVLDEVRQHQDMLVHRERGIDHLSMQCRKIIQGMFAVSGAQIDELFDAYDAATDDNMSETSATAALDIEVQEEEEGEVPSAPVPAPADITQVMTRYTVKNLIDKCRESGIRGYSGKTKEVLISMLANAGVHM